jgi:transcriptional regulator with XRE-family HTH domain
VNRFAPLLKSRRTRLGLTQVTLAHASGVSLPTIQNLEAGRGNPSLSVLEPLFAALELKIEIHERAVDWNLLARLGVPITSDGSEASADSPQKKGDRSAALLMNELKRAAFELNGQSEDPERPRKRDAVQALLLALHDHFPAFYKAQCESVPVLHELLPARKEITGRIIKLRRIAIANLVEYLWK